MQTTNQKAHQDMIFKHKRSTHGHQQPKSPARNDF